MWRQLLIGALLFVLLPGSSRAQTYDPDYQARILGHVQLTPQKGTLGFAGWGILPDVANPNPHRAVLLAGLVGKNDRRWLELMYGGLFAEGSPGTFIADIRMLDRSIQRVELFFEVDYRPMQERLALFPIATTSFEIGGIPFRVGVEADLTMTPQSRGYVIGPRLGIPLPVSKTLCKSATLTTAFRFASDGTEVIRQYLGFTF
jgi:hypothetical protein